MMRTLIGTSALTLVILACGDDGAQPGDLGDTTDGGDGADTIDTSETTGDDTTVGDGDTTIDVEDTRDTASGDVVDVPLEGTALEGIGVRWPAAVELCNAWREGASIEAEVAHQVRVSMPAQVRTDLSFGALGAQRIEGIDLMTGPFAADRHVVGPVTGVITDYRVVRGVGYDGFAASLRYDLGAAGVLREEYNLTRSADLTTDVVIGGDGDAGYEVIFAWSPNADSEPHVLEPCAPPEGEDRAIAVLVGTNAEAVAKAVTLVRFYDTHDVFAGSYPVRMVASQVILSDQPWRVFEVGGRWAQIYAAQHHNWVEESRLDFARDLAGWQTVFKPLAEGEPVLDGTVAKVQLAAIGGGGRGTIAVTRLSQAGAPSDTVYAAAGDWRRVDPIQLGREAGCEGAVIGAIGYGDHIAQLVFCPELGAPRGLDLVMVVPVVWSSAPELAGLRAGKEAIQAFSGRLGWSVAVGDGTLTVEPMNEDGYLTDVLDANGQSLAQTYSTLYALSNSQSWDQPVHSQAGDVRVEIARQWAAMGVGESSIFAVDAMTLAWGDTSYTVRAWDRIDYVNTHHNWNDTATATTDDGHVLHWKIIYDFEGGLGLVETVWAEDADGNQVLPPTVVTPVASAGE